MQNAKPTNFMEASKVIETLEYKLGKWVVATMVKDNCKLHTIESIKCYSTTDLKTFVFPQVFRQLESEVTTYVIESK